MDQTFIKNLHIQGIIGITEQERSHPQEILVNITLYGDVHKAGLSDNINDCINYATIVIKTTAFVEKAARFTVEALASDIANLCLQEKGVKGVRVRVEKPNAIQAAQSVGVEIERQAINDGD